MIDFIRSSVINEELTDEASKYVLKNVDPAKCEHISRQKNSSGSRKIIINHLRTTLFSSYVKDICEEVTHYLRTIIEKSVENGSMTCVFQLQVFLAYSVKLKQNEINRSASIFFRGYDN